MLVVFLPIFVADTKTIYGYNFVAPLNNPNVLALSFATFNLENLIRKYTCITIINLLAI